MTFSFSLLPSSKSVALKSYQETVAAALKPLLRFSLIFMPTLFYIQGIRRAVPATSPWSILLKFLFVTFVTIGDKIP